MPDRKYLASALSLTFLLALMLVAPVRTSGLVTVSSRPDCHHRNCALPAGEFTTRRGAAGTTDRVQDVKALRSEDEEQEKAEALGETRVSFLSPGSFREVPDRQLIAPSSIPSRYPFRC